MRSMSVVLASLLLLGSCQSLAAPISGAPAPQLQTQSHTQQRPELDAIVQKHMQNQNLVGLALGVVENGRVSYLKGFGWADKESKTPVDLSSSFRWASISKTVTAVLSMQLVEQGRLNLDTPIQHYWPQYHNAQGWPVTQRQLLGHLSGVGSYNDVPGWKEGLQTYHQRSLSPEVQGADMRQASADIFAFAPLMTRPGSAYRYSTFGSMLAGAIVNQAGGSPFVQQFETRIRRPLGLDSLQPDHQSTPIPHRVSGYYRSGTSVQKQANKDVSWKLAGGGFTSNIKDLSRYMQALINQDLLQPASYKEMWRPQTTTGGKNTGYGLSFGVSKHGADRSVGHFGAQEKTRTVMSLLPERKLGVVLMCNSEWADLSPLRTELLSALKGS